MSDIRELWCIDISGVIVLPEPAGRGFQAHVEGKPADWSRGNTKDEAVGSLIRRLALEHEGAKRSPDGGELMALSLVKPAGEPQAWTPGLYTAQQIPESAYHRDDVGSDVPTLSRSTAAELVNESPADAWDHHPQLGGIPKRKVTREMEFASLVHSLILGSGPEFLVLPPSFKDYKKDAAQDLRDDARAAGKIPMLASEAEEAKALANRLRPQVEDWVSGYVEFGQPEVTVLWEEDDFFSPIIRCRSRMDLWVPNHIQGPMIIDLKIVENVGETFERSMTPHGLDIQAYSYTRAMETVYPELAGRIRFMFLLCRNDGRHVVPVYPGRTKIELGGHRWDRAVKMWAGCLSEGLAPQHWPGPPARVAEASNWELTRELEYELAEGDGDGSES